MSDVSVQLYAFAVCMLAGALGGVLYEGAALVRFFTGNRAARAAADAVVFLLCVPLFAAAGAIFCLPSFRVYMLAAFGAGFGLYRKSLHRIVAFFALKLYNKYRSGSKKKNSRAVCAK